MPAAWVLLTALSLAPAFGEGREAYQAYSDAFFSFEYPAGWKVEARLDFQQESIQVYLGEGPYGATGAASGWAVVHIEVFDPSRPSGLPGRGACPAAKVRNLEDYRAELDCSVPQSCRPCPDRKCPRSPVFGFCGRSPTPVESGGNGYLYLGETGEVTRHKLGKGQELEGYFIFNFPGDPVIYRIDFDAPAEEFKRYLPAIEHLVETFRPKKAA